MQKNSNNNWLHIGKMFLFTTLAAALVTAVLLLITAVLLDKLGLSREQVRLFTYGIYLFGSLAAGLLAGKLKRERKFLWGLAAGLVWFVVVAAVSLGVNGTAMELKELFPGAVCMLGGGMLGGMLA